MRQRNLKVNTVNLRSPSFKPLESRDPSPQFIQQAKQNIWMELRTNKLITPRSYHTTVIWNNQLHVYGGYEVHSGILDDFYSFDFTTMQWNQYLDWNQHYPGQRRRHSATVYRNKMIIFGGQITSSTSTNEMNEYNFMTNEWEIIEHDLPWPIDSQNACVHEDCMIIFGGYLGGQKGHYSNKVFQFKIEEREWSEISAKSQSQPIARSASGMVKEGNHIVIFGGTNGVRKLDDLWLFDLVRLEWEQVRGRNQAPQGRHGMSLSVYGNGLIVFGGIRDITRERNDMYIFNMEEREWRQVFMEENKLSLPPIEKGIEELSVKRSVSIKKQSHSRLIDNISIHQTAFKSVSPSKREFEEQQLYQFFFALNQSLAHQQKRKQQLQKREQFLKDLEVKNDREREALRTVTPISEALRQSLHMIGHQPKIMEGPQQLYNEYNVPCARDGHTADIMLNSDGQPMLVVFGGDRHLISFNDLYICNINKLFNP